MKKIAIEEHVNEQDLGQMEKRLQDMERAGVDMQVLSYAFHYAPGTGAKAALAESRKINDSLAGVVEKYPGNFAAFAALAIEDAEAAAGELQRAVKELGLKGTLIFGTGDGGYLDDPKYEAIFAMSQELDVPVYIHASAPQGEAAKAYRAYPGLEMAILGFAAETSLQAMRLILSGIFDRYPRLKIILGHMGEALPYWLWRIDSRWWEVRQRDPAADAFYKDYKKTPSQYFRDNFSITTSGMFWHPPLTMAISALGAEKVLFAVDYPPESIDDAAQFIETAPIPPGEKELVCYRNAERLLKLKL